MLLHIYSIPSKYSHPRNLGFQKQIFREHLKNRIFRGNTVSSFHISCTSFSSIQCTLFMYQLEQTKPGFIHLGQGVTYEFSNLHHVFGTVRRSFFCFDNLTFPETVSPLLLSPLLFTFQNQVLGRKFKIISYHFFHKFTANSLANH